MHSTKRLFVLLLVVLFAAAGCSDDSSEPADTDAAPPTREDTTATEVPRTATAILSPTEGHAASGEVTFLATEDGVQITATVLDLSEGAHGFHIHETGDCSAPDASSAGGHFNPGNTPHGAPDSPADQRHMGDLGNLEADPDGTATYDRVDTVVAFDAIIGKAVVVHSGADDLTSQPSGDAGARVACGVIQVP